MTSQLAIITPLEDAPTTLPLSGKLILGSSSERADIVFNSQGVAKVHSVIAKTKDGGWAIQDMGSEFGTIIDGTPVEVARLKAGQTILLASVSIKVVEIGAVPQEEPAPSPQAPKPAPKQKKQVDAAVPAARSTSPHILDIPGYSLQETLGKGGMGAVFRARQDRLNRDVALKILSPRLAADAQFVRRFHKEAQAAAALNHPNIVTVYDVGEAAGTHFIAMEYMDNNSLEELLEKEGRLPWKRVAEMLLGAARGLTYAESRRIVHRDIKPSNLMLNSDAQVKISDLGLAQKDNEDTGDGKVFGTPHFISPEQIRGGLVDRRCDIYSLGATGYQLLTGYTPFEGVNSREILRAVLKEEFEPIEAHVSGTPRALSDLIERMIARDPDERPQSAEAVVTHLQNILSGSETLSGAGATAPSSGGGPSRLVTVGLALAAIFAAAFFLPTPLRDFLSKEKGEPSNPAETVVQENPGAAQAEKDRTGEELADSSQAPKDPGLEPTPVATVDTAPAEDDAAQKDFEDKAELALLRMESSDLTMEERRIKLLEISEKYNGTTAAAKALAKAQINSALIKEEEARAAALLETRQKVLAEITEAAGLKTSPTLPAKALAAILAVPGQDALSADETFINARARLRDQVCEKALSECSALFAEAEQNLTNPDPQLTEQALQGLVARLQLSDKAPLGNPNGYEDLRRLEANARTLLSDLDRRRRLANANLALADGTSIASYCHSQSEDGLIADLRGLKLSTASGKLRVLEAKVQSQERRADVSQLAADLEAAAGALGALVDSYDQWKRTTVTDPRPRRPSAEATSLNADGLTLSSASGGGDFISWAAFSANPDSLNKLFFKRLDREWSPEERRGIALILNFSATINAVEESMKAFGAPADLKPKKAEALIDALSISDQWLEGDDSIEQNCAAAAALFSSLELAGAEQWTAAESGVRYASERFAGSLFLLLLSDGTPPKDPAATPAKVEPAADTPAQPDSPAPPANPGDK